MELTLELNAVTIWVMISVAGFLMAAFAFKLDNSDKYYKLSDPLGGFGILVILVGGIGITISWCMRDYEELPDGTKVTIVGSFDDGLDGYNYNGRYGIVGDSSKTCESVRVKIVSLEKGYIKHQIVSFSRENVRMVPNDEFFASTGIKPPGAQEMTTATSQPTTQPAH